MKSKFFSIFIALFLMVALLSGSGVFALKRANTGGDIVGGASDDIAGGASVFVFRGSKKQPHNRNNFRKGGAKRSAQAKADSRRVRLNQSSAFAAKRPPKTFKPNPKAVPKEKQAEAAIAAGQKLLDAKSYDQAEAKFKQATQLAPKNEFAKDGLQAVYTAKGNRAFEGKNYGDAIKFYEQANSINSTNADVFANLGEAYDSVDQTQKAVFAYEAALRLNPELSVVAMTLADMHFETGNFAKAETLLGEAVAKDQNNVELLGKYGTTLVRLDKLNEAAVMFQTASKVMPAYAPAYQGLGEIYDRQGKQTEAAAAYREAIRQNPNLAEAYNGLGAVAYNQEKYPDAVQNYQKAIDLKPDYVEARNNLADAYRQMEKFPEAVAVYKTIVPYTPNDPDLHSKYGYCEGKAGNWGESSRLLEKTAELDKGQRAEEYSNVAWAQNNAGREAKKANNETLANENFAKAKTNAQKAADKDPNSSAAKFNLGDSLTGLGEAALAVTILQGLVGANPQWAEARNSLGLAMFMAGDYNSASNELRTATSLNGNLVSAFANLALVETKRGNKKDAKKAQDRVKQLNPKMAAALDNFIAQKLIQIGTDKLKDKIRDKVRLPF